MSLPDYLLEDEGDICESCGEWMRDSRSCICLKCRIEHECEMADEKISEGGGIVIKRKSSYVQNRKEGPDGIGDKNTKKKGTLKSNGTNSGKGLLRKLNRLGIK